MAGAHAPGWGRRLDPRFRSRGRSRGGADRLVEVQVHGAGWAGLAVAKGLAAAGVDVRLVDPAGALAGASGQVLGIVLPTHAEHAHRLEAGIGTVAAQSLVAFLREGLSLFPNLRRCGVAWRLAPNEAAERDPALAAAARIGLAVRPTSDGYFLLDGGVAEPIAPDFPVHADPVPAELDVYTTGPAPADPFLADKITPVRVQAATFAAPLTPDPIVTQHATVAWLGNDAVGAAWATPHLEVGETDPVPEPRVTAMLERLTQAAFPGAGVVFATRAGIVGESCDGLPIVGPVPGRPRAIVCAGFGRFGLGYVLPCARSVVDGILGRTGPSLPTVLRAGRFR